MTQAWSFSSVWQRGLSGALRPISSPWVWWPALWVMVAGGTVTCVGLFVGYSDATGLAYFGVGCAALFVGNAAFRTRIVMCGAQGGGAAMGIVLGTVVHDSSAGKVVLAAAVTVVSGAVGGIGGRAQPGR